MAKKTTKRRSTIYDIAAAAETSPSTVSLVLNGSWERYRIKADTAERVTKTAREIGYNANQRARGLRLDRSSLAGMIIPHYRNRFFAGLAEVFEAKARERGLCPIVASTQRDDVTERAIVETMIAQRVECLIIAGADRPDELNALCRAAGIACVNLDLPGSGAPSVVTDNRGGSIELTLRLIDRVVRRGGDPRAIRFVGGRTGEYATDGRISGFFEAFARRGIEIGAGSISSCGYHPRAAHEIFSSFVADNAPPSGIFVNSITALEGFAILLRENGMPFAPVLACFDWDPFAAALPLPVFMMRQNVDALIVNCFDVLDGSSRDQLIIVAPKLAFAPPATEAEIARTIA